MQTLIVVSGEKYWADYFPEYEVQRRQLQWCEWLWRDNELWAVDASGWTQVDAVLWRLVTERPSPIVRDVLEIIRLTEVPCVNSASTLLRGRTRLSRLAEIRECRLPMLPISIGSGERVHECLLEPLPSGEKLATLYQSWDNPASKERQLWNDFSAPVSPTEDYIAEERFAHRAQDVRCLCISEEIWAMSRRSTEWKVNRGMAEPTLIDVPTLLFEYSKRLQRHLKADVLALDCLQTRDGEWFVLEYNDIPGLSGFPTNVRESLARCVREHMSNIS